jgi:hypothetical protein
MTDTLVAPADHKPHTYDFYSVARDLVGNIEPTPLAPEATTQSRTGVGEEPRRAPAIEGVRPNPTAGPLAVWFTLSSRMPARLDLIDLAGRRVLRREVGSLGRGRHVLSLAPSRRLESGLYFVRLAQGGFVSAERVAVIH